METCPHCGAAMSSEGVVCPACGTAVSDELAHDHAPEDTLTPDEQLPEDGADDATLDGAVDDLAADDLAASDVEASDPGEAVDADVTSVSDSMEAEALDPPVVPAGTWASTSESAPPPAPGAGALEREPDTRRVRRLPDDTDRHRVERVLEARPRRAGTPRDGVGRAEGLAREAVARAESARAEGAARVDGAARARARALAVAPAPAEPEEQEQPEAEVVAFPAPATASASSSGIRSDLAVAPGPPKWLASEILREATPTEPSGWTTRAIATAGGIAGAAASLVIGNGGPDLGMAGLFVALAGLAIVPVPFAIRAGGFAVIASIGLALATWARIGGVEGEAIGLAILGTTLLAAAQLLRAVQRRSRFAKIASMLGIAVTACWLALDGGLGAMVVHGDGLEDWLGPLARASLMIVLALSLLGFLDDSGTSGNHVWPWLVLGWIALEAAVTIAMLGTDQTLATAATPVFSAVAALGWMQVWATTPGLGAKEPVRARQGDG